MYKFIFFILFFTHFCSFGQVKVMKDQSQLENLSNKATSFFMENKMSDCFGELKTYWPIPENEVEELKDKTARYMNLIEERFGKAIDYKKIKNETIADFAIRETYMIRFENTAIRLIYTYYKNKNGWILNEFKWDDTFSLEFKEN